MDTTSWTTRAKSLLFRCPQLLRANDRRKRQAIIFRPVHTSCESSYSSARHSSCTAPPADEENSSKKRQRGAPNQFQSCTGIAAFVSARRLPLQASATACWKESTSFNNGDK